MAYLDPDMLTARVGGATNYLKLTNDEVPTGTSPDPNVEALLLDNVDRMMDSYAVRGGYDTPLSKTDAAFVIPWLLDISNYKAKSRGNRKASDDDLQAYQDALKFLEMIATGDVVLPSGGGTGVSNGSVDVVSCPPLYTRGTLRHL